MTKQTAAKWVRRYPLFGKWAIGVSIGVGVLTWAFCPEPQSVGEWIFKYGATPLLILAGIVMQFVPRLMRKHLEAADAEALEVSA